MVQPRRADEPANKVIAFRVTPAERDEFNRLIDILAPELPDRSLGAALRRLAHDALHGVVVPLTDDDRAKLDRLVAARVAELARLGVHEARVTPASMLVTLLRAAPVAEHEAAAPTHEEPVEAIPKRRRGKAAPTHEEPVEAIPKRRRGKAAPTHEEPVEADMETVRADLAAALDAKSATPADLAAAIGVTTSTISHFKSGRRGMVADKVQKLAEYLREHRRE
jgi:hypothetical protein